MTELTVGMRDITQDEIDEVSGGWVPLVMAVGAVAVGAYLAANFAAGFIDGARGKESQTAK